MGEQKNKIRQNNIFAELSKAELDAAAADAQEVAVAIMTELQRKATEWGAAGLPHIAISARIVMLLPALLGSSYATVATAHDGGLNFLNMNWPAIQRQAYKHFAAGMAEQAAMTKPPH